MRVYVHMYTCAHVSVRMWARVYLCPVGTCPRVHMYTCTHVCVCVSLCTRTVWVYVCVTGLDTFDDHARDVHTGGPDSRMALHRRYNDPPVASVESREGGSPPPSSPHPSEDDVGTKGGTLGGAQGRHRVEYRWDTGRNTGQTQGGTQTGNKWDTGRARADTGGRRRSEPRRGWVDGSVGEISSGRDWESSGSRDATRRTPGRG